MTDKDMRAQQAFEGYSDSELLAFWAATERVDQVEEDAPETGDEIMMISIAWQELVRRSLLPR